MLLLLVKLLCRQVVLHCPRRHMVNPLLLKDEVIFFFYFVFALFYLDKKLWFFYIHLHCLVYISLNVSIKCHDNLLHSKK